MPTVIETRAVDAVDALIRTGDLQQFVRTVGIWSGKYYRFGNSDFFLGAVCDELNRRNLKVI